MSSRPNLEIERAAQIEQFPIDRVARERIVAAAISSFLELGYERTTLDGVAKAARASKTTVYECFPHKAAMFEASVKSALAPIIDAQPAFSSDARRPQMVLEDISRWIGSNFMRPENLGLYRVNIEIAAHFPDLAGALNGYRQRQGSAAVARYLAKLSAKGAIAIGDPDEAARWIGVLSVAGTYHLMGGAPPDKAALDGRSRAIAALFMNGARAVNDGVGISPPDAEEERPRPQMRLADDRYQHLLSVAADEFTAFGFRGANVDRLVDVTGISKMTIRRHHTNKAGLYRAAMQYRAVHHAFRMQIEKDLPPRKALTKAGLAVINQAFDHDRVQFQRAVIADAPRDPATARAVYHALGDKAVAALSSYFCDLGFAQPTTLARQFIILAASGNIALVGNQVPVQLDWERHVRAIVDLMLR